MYGFFYGFRDGCFAAFHFQSLDRINRPANALTFRKISTEFLHFFPINSWHRPYFMPAHLGY